MLEYFAGFKPLLNFFKNILVVVGAPTLLICSTQAQAGNYSAGTNALGNITTGDGNVAVGPNALFSLTKGSDNVAIGENAMKQTTTAEGNVAVGQNALQANTTGEDNVAIGSDALEANTTGSDLTAIGKKALQNNTTGQNNTGIGRNTLQNDKAPVQALVLRELEKAPMTVTELGDALGKDKGQISNICSSLATEGKISWSDRTKPWRLVDAS